MKKLMVTFLLILCTVSFAFANADLEDLSEELNAMELIENVSIQEKDQHLLIQLNSIIFDEKMIYYYQDIIKKAYEEIPSRSITLEIYDAGLPILRIQSLNKDIVAFTKDEISREIFIERMNITDIRSIEHVIYDELNLFDAIIIGIDISEDKSTIQLESMKKSEDFQDDFMAMALTVIENTPWINELEFQFFKDEDLIMTIKGAKDDFLLAIKGTMSEEKFIESLVVQIPVKTKKEELEEGQTIGSVIEEYPMINVSSAEVKGVISTGRKIYQLVVPKSEEYRFNINNLDTVKTEMTIYDEDFKIIADNLRNDELIKSIDLNLEKGKDYYLEIKTSNTTIEEIDIAIGKSNPISKLFISFLVVSSVLIIGMIKYKRNQKRDGEVT